MTYIALHSRYAPIRPNRVYNSYAELIDELKDFQKAVQVFHNRKYPASKQELVEEAKNLHIRSIIVRALEACPDKQYNSPDDVINECKTRFQGR